MSTIHDAIREVLRVRDAEREDRASTEDLLDAVAGLEAFVTPPQQEYLVTWSIELTAATPEEAARQALQIQRDPESLAVSFEVDGQIIDLMEGD